MYLCIYIHESIGGRARGTEDSETRRSAELGTGELWQQYDHIGSSPNSSDQCLYSGSFLLRSTPGFAWFQTPCWWIHGWFSTCLAWFQVLFQDSRPLLVNTGLSSRIAWWTFHRSWWKRGCLLVDCRPVLAMIFMIFKMCSLLSSPTSLSDKLADFLKSVRGFHLNHFNIIELWKV